MSRRINAPGIEVNEIDRSGYDETVDNSVIGTTTLVLGFADKGEEYNVKWMNSMNTFLRTYGTPKTEAEKYLYNTVYEVLDRGGTCYTAKLPYDNDSLERYVFTSYSIDSAAKELKQVSSIVNNIYWFPKGDDTEEKSKSSLVSYLFYANEEYVRIPLFNLGDETRTLSVIDDIIDFVETEANFTKEDIDVLHNRCLTSYFNKLVADIIFIKRLLNYNPIDYNPTDPSTGIKQIWQNYAITVNKGRPDEHVYHATDVETTGQDDYANISASLMHMRECLM